MMLGTDYPDNHLPDDDGANFLAAVTPQLSSADLAFGNLEGVLLDGGEPAKKCKDPAACYLFRSPPRYADHFLAAGFDVLSLANNHARDFGEEGRTATMEALDAAAILHSGREGEFASLEIDGLTVALLAYAVTKDSNMMLDYALAEATVAEFAETHDIVIVSFHGGAEGVNATNLPFAEEEYYDEPGNFATYYGISVAGIKGIAPILMATLDGEGRFVEGEIVSTVQIRPDGPSIDRRQRALNLMRDLSIEDFGESGVRFEPDGKILPD